jgi:hypothetical protein
MEKITSIRIFESTWKRLHDKKDIGITFDRVINDMLDELEVKKE